MNEYHYSLIIRDPIIEDKDNIYKMAKNFYLSSNYEQMNLSFSRAAVYKFIHFVIESPMYILKVAELNERLVGLICGMCTPWHIDPNQSILIELYWWAEPELEINIGNDLLTEYEKEAKNRGINFLTMGTQSYDREDILCKFFERKGYKHLNKTYIKEL